MNCEEEIDVEARQAVVEHLKHQITACEEELKRLKSLLEKICQKTN